MSGTSLPPVHVWVHGARPEVHDFHAGEARAFAKLLTTLGDHRREGVPSIASTILTRSNQAVIGEVPAFLTARGIRAWRVAVPRVAGASPTDDAPEFTGAPARLALALPYALHALSRAERSGIEVYVSGAPLCLLGPFASRALPSDDRAYAPPCEPCLARDECPGVEASYLERFAGDELRPREAARTPRARPAAWSEAFAAVAEPAIPTAARAARGTLPVVG